MRAPGWRSCIGGGARAPACSHERREHPGLSERCSDDAGTSGFASIRSSIRRGRAIGELVRSPRRLEEDGEDGRGELVIHLEGAHGEGHGGAMEARCDVERERLRGEVEQLARGAVNKREADRREAHAKGRAHAAVVLVLGKTTVVARYEHRTRLQRRNSRVRGAGCRPRGAYA